MVTIIFSLLGFGIIRMVATFRCDGEEPVFEFCSEV